MVKINNRTIEKICLIKIKFKEGNIFFRNFGLKKCFTGNFQRARLYQNPLTAKKAIKKIQKEFKDFYGGILSCEVIQAI